MTGKKISIGAKPSGNQATAAADNWVESRTTTPPPGAQEKMKRLTIDIPEKLHRKIKSDCATRGSKIVDEVRELLLLKYGKE
jgi:hypothetical protein